MYRRIKPMSNTYSFKTCINCGTVKRSNGRKYCSNTCQNDFQYKDRIARWLTGEINGRRGKTATAHWIKRYLVQTRGHKCECCHNTEWLGTPILLELEHVDGDFLNNKIGNLKLLCLNCHGQTPTYRSKNKRGRPRAKYYRGL